MFEYLHPVTLGAVSLVVRAFRRQRHLTLVAAVRIAPPARENAQADCTDMFQSPPRPRVKSSRTGGSLAGGRGKTTLHTVMDGAGRPRASLSHGSRRAFFKWRTEIRG